MDTFMNKQGDKYEVGEMGRDFGGLKKKKKKSRGVMESVLYFRTVAQVVGC